MKALSQRQSAMLDFLRRYIAENSQSPSIPEIMKAMQYSSPNSVTGILVVLEREGYISREKGKWRSVKVLRTDDAGWSFGGPLGAMITCWTGPTLSDEGSVVYQARVELQTPDGVLTHVYTLEDGMTRSEVAAGMHAAALRLLAHELLEQQQLDGSRVWAPHEQNGDPIVDPAASTWIGPTGEAIADVEPCAE